MVATMGDRIAPTLVGTSPSARITSAKSAMAKALKAAEMDNCLLMVKLCAECGLNAG